MSGEPPMSSVEREGPILQRRCHLSQLSTTTRHSCPESSKDPATPIRHYSLAHKTLSISRAIGPPHVPKSVKSLPHSHALCGHHNNVPGCSVPSRSILSKPLFLLEPQLKQSSTDYSKPPLQFPINLTTTLQQISGFAQSLCT